MKKIVLMLVLLIFTSNAFAQKYSEEKLRERLSHFQNMQKKGKGLVIGGVILNLIGVPLYINGLNELSKHSENDIDPESVNGASIVKTFGGMVAMAVGQVAIAGGITFWAFSSSRIRTYKKLLGTKETKLGLCVDFKGVGLQLNF